MAVEGGQSPRQKSLGNVDEHGPATHAEIERCIEHAPDVDWRCIIALARYGGLRCPSEILALRVEDVNLPDRRMVVRASKTAHHSSGGVRVCPIFPELFPYVQEAWENAEPGQEYLITRYRSSSQNLRTTFEKIITRAGLEPWPKRFQNLRASRETELLGLYPAKDVASWLGNSIPVAMAHYAMTRAESFEAATRRGARDAEAHQNAHHSGAITTVQEPSADASGCGETSENTAKDASSGPVTPPDDYQLIGRAGFEPAT